MLTLADPTSETLTTRQAAQVARVSTDVVRQWAARGHLPVAERDERGWPRYRLVDVAKAEHATRRHARRSHAA